ncbi:hypothetical protein D9M71_478370 [compost metagenome]
MQGRGTHVHLIGQTLDLQWLVEVLPQPAHRAADAVTLGAAAGDLAQLRALLTAQQAVEDLAAHQRRQGGNVLGGIEQAYQAQNGILQGSTKATHRQATRTRLGHRRGNRQVHQQGADLFWVEVQAQAEERHLRAGLGDLADHRQVHRYHQVLPRSVMIGLVAQDRLLATLYHQAQGGLVETVQRFAG